jgi:hypothetical protein
MIMTNYSLPNNYYNASSLVSENHKSVLNFY